MLTNVVEFSADVSALSERAEFVASGARALTNPREFLENRSASALHSPGEKNSALLLSTAGAIGTNSTRFVSTFFSLRNSGQ